MGATCDLRLHAIVNESTVLGQGKHYPSDGLANATVNCGYCISGLAVALITPQLVGYYGGRPSVAFWPASFFVALSAAFASVLHDGGDATGTKPPDKDYSSVPTDED